MMFSLGSVNVGAAQEFAKGAGTKAFSPRDAAEVYVLNGIGAKMFNRNIDQGVSKDVGTYGVGGVAYLGLGVDGSFIPLDGEGGNYRIELFAAANGADPTTMKALYPGAQPKNLTYGYGLNVTIYHHRQAGPQFAGRLALGAPSRQYQQKIFLAGITLSQ
jgi:hypothetical protein